MKNHSGLYFIRVGLLLSLLLPCLPVAFIEADSRVEVRLDHVYLSQKVKSLYELRWNKLSRQGWDMSCGAAALSTLLTYHNGRQFSEISITLSILKNTDPALVRKRGGFSLYDLKRFVQAVDLEGLGFGEMTLDELDNFSAPAILPIRIKGFDHFVVFRSLLGDHVLAVERGGNIDLSGRTQSDMRVLHGINAVTSVAANSFNVGTMPVFTGGIKQLSLQQHNQFVQQR